MSDRSPQVAIALNGVNKWFRGANGTSTQALQEISLTIEDGAFVSLLGPSGCGKTTLLRLLDGLLVPDSGSVEIFGKPPRPGPEMGFVFQSFRLIPWETVRGNVEFALRALNLPAGERRARAEKVIEMVGLAGSSGAYPRELSGGMKQRVALARALSCEPRVLLMDEPFASIDAQTRELMQIELMRIWSLHQAVAVFVTHSVDEAILLSDRVVLMGPRPGRIVEIVDIDLPRPRWTYDARSEPRFVELRQYLSRRLRELVMNDPHSEFFGRKLGD